MITVPLASSVVVLGAAMLLVVAGVGHTRRTGEFAAAMRRHAVVSRRLIRAVTPLLGPLEIAVGAGALLTWIFGAPPPVFGLATTAVVVVYVGFGLYTLEATRSAPGSPCACFGTGEPLTWAVPARALVLGAASLPALSVTLPPTQARLIALGAAVLVALTAWALPVVVAGAGGGSARAGVSADVSAGRPSRRS